MSIKSSIDDLIRTFYNRRSDSTLDKNINQRASTVKDFYMGYPYVIQWEATIEQYQKLDTARLWCKNNCIGRYTTHIHRVIPDAWTKEMAFNELGGIDTCFWAFTDESDAVMFALTW